MGVVSPSSISNSPAYELQDFTFSEGSSTAPRKLGFIFTGQGA
jgi:hypothetical protein